MVSIDKMIRTAAKENGITMSKLAINAGIAPAQVSASMKKGTLNLTTICRLAAALNMKASDFLKYGEE